MTLTYEYPLGYSQGEAKRLEVQALVLQEFLENTLRRAGLRTGMRVLDIGCGVGDVSFVASRIVGKSGSVLGLDRATDSIKTAERRAEFLTLTNANFEVAELESYRPHESFDAVIGRFILLYLTDPSVLLTRLQRSVRHGGIIVMQELDMSVASQYPSSALFEAVNSWIFGAFDSSGAEKDMGRKLLSTFLTAGLPWPEMNSTTPITSGPESPYYVVLTEMVRSMLPVIERNGLATQGEIGLETLAKRLRDDAVSNSRVLFPPRVISAWCSLT